MAYGNDGILFFLTSVALVLLVYWMQCNDMDYDEYVHNMKCCLVRVGSGTISLSFN